MPSSALHFQQPSCISRAYVVRTRQHPVLTFSAGRSLALRHPASPRQMLPEDYLFAAVSSVLGWALSSIPLPGEESRTIAEQMVEIGDALEILGLSVARLGAAVVSHDVLAGLLGHLDEAMTTAGPGTADGLSEAYLTITGVFAVVAVKEQRVRFRMVSEYICAIVRTVDIFTEVVLSATPNQRKLFDHLLRPNLLQLAQLAAVLEIPGGVHAGTPDSAKALELCREALEASEERLDLAVRSQGLLLQGEPPAASAADNRRWRKLQVWRSREQRMIDALKAIIQGE